MRHATLATAALGLGLLAISPAFSSTVTPQLRAEKAIELKYAVSELPLEESDHFKRLEGYVLNAMKTWAPAATIAGTHSQDDFETIARDMVSVVLDPGEPALFADTAEKERTAILLATMAYYEGHFWPYVDSGLCNDPKEKNNPILRNGNCDNGEAISFWQIHPGRGIVLLDNGLYGYRVSVTDKAPRVGVRAASADATRARPLSVDPLSVVESKVATAESLHDRRFAAKTALHMLRASLKRDGTLCEYTGELKPCPKAEKRLKFAREWSDKHPY
jgi:hypothetical protein